MCISHWCCVWNIVSYILLVIINNMYFNTLSPHSSLERLALWGSLGRSPGFVGGVHVVHRFSFRCCVFCICFVCHRPVSCVPMLTVSLNCPFSITHKVVSNVYWFLFVELFSMIAKRYFALLTVTVIEDSIEISVNYWNIINNHGNIYN